VTESLRFVCVGLIVELFACDQDRSNSESHGRISIKFSEFFGTWKV